MALSGELATPRETRTPGTGGYSVSGHRMSARTPGVEEHPLTWFGTTHLSRIWIPTSMLRCASSVAFAQFGDVKLPASVCFVKWDGIVGRAGVVSCTCRGGCCFVYVSGVHMNVFVAQVVFVQRRP